MWLNLICATGRGTEGAELTLDKTTGVEGSLKTIKPGSKEMWERNYTSMSRKIRGESYWPDSPSERRRKNWLKN